MDGAATLFSWELVALEVERRMEAKDAIRILEEAVSARGSAPEFIRSDHGPELVALAVREWSARRGCKTLSIKPGSPWPNASSITEEDESRSAVEQEKTAARRLFVLRVVQPGLAGLMDGSVSTLAPLFAAAFATGNSLDAFRVGLAASIGAGISMGFAEALSDDGQLSGRGGPLLRGTVCGLMTTAGGIGHTLPYLLGDFRTATAVAVGVVGIELGVIAWIRHRFMETPWLYATVQVVLGGVLVLIAGILIGIG